MNWERIFKLHLFKRIWFKWIAQHWHLFIKQKHLILHLKKILPMWSDNPTCRNDSSDVMSTKSHTQSNSSALNFRSCTGSNWPTDQTRTRFPASSFAITQKTASQWEVRHYGWRHMWFINKLFFTSQRLRDWPHIQTKVWRPPLCLHEQKYCKKQWSFNKKDEVKLW